MRFDEPAHMTATAPETSPQPVHPETPLSTPLRWFTGESPVQAILLKLGLPGLAAILCILLALSYQDAQKQAASDIRNLNLAVESQLDATFIRLFERALTEFSSTVSINGLTHADSREVARDAAWQVVRRYPRMDFSISNRDGQTLFQSGRVSDTTSPLPYFEPPSQAYDDFDVRKRIVYYGRPGSGDRVLSAALPCFDQHRQLIGWVSVSLPLVLVKELLNGFNVGKGGVITVRNTRPVDVLLRSPNDAAPSPHYQPDAIDDLVHAGQQEGVLTQTSRVDGAKRLYGFKRIGQSSLVVVVGFAPHDYLSEWYYNLLLTVSLIMILVFAIAFSVSHMRDYKRNRALTEYQLRTQEERTRLLVDSVGQAIFCLDVYGNCDYLNKAAAQLFGVDQLAWLDNDTLDGLFIKKFDKGGGLSSRVIDTVTQHDVCYFESNLLGGRDGQGLPIEVRGYAHYAGEVFVGVVITIQDISERHAHESQIAFLAYHDALTRLPNRLFIRERFDEVAREGTDLALLYLDIDNFKLINDSLGHVVGDELLCVVADRLSRMGAKVDTVARLGGDEFLLLVRGKSRDTLIDITSCIARRIGESCAFENYHLTITPSIGVALFPEHGASFDELLRAADIGLYQAKSAGRNTWRMYEHEMGQRELYRLELQMDLRAAWGKRELVIHYQPQIDLATNRIIGVEALLRWFHPTKGTVPPSEFIPVAEHCGLMIPISRWLIHEVCSQAMRWQAMGLGERVVAINCSAVQFHQGDLVSDVRSVLQETGLSPALLELEITESILIEDTPKVMATITQLKALGIRMSIDDFGTGYSSMAYLKRFAVDKLKIDQSFVKGMLENPQDTAIVKSVIALAHSLQMKATAEGVESEAIVSALNAAGCDEAQGYFYARPCDAEGIERLLCAFPEATLT